MRKLFPIVETIVKRATYRLPVGGDAGSPVIRGVNALLVNSRD
jgi:hypothetical protein